VVVDVLVVAAQPGQDERPAAVPQRRADDPRARVADDEARATRGRLDLLGA
jgi:hypothetical protein